MHISPTCQRTPNTIFSDSLWMSSSNKPCIMHAEDRSLHVWIWERFLWKCTLCRLHCLLQRDNTFDVRGCASGSMRGGGRAVYLRLIIKECAVAGGKWSDWSILCNRLHAQIFVKDHKEMIARWIHTRWINAAHGKTPHLPQGFTKTHDLHIRRNS